MKKISVVVWVVLFTGTLQAWAQPKGFRIMKDTTAFIKKFDEKSVSIRTNEADFIQEKYISVMTDKMVSKGKFCYKQPDKMRWETVEPQSHIIVLNNGKMMIREKGKIRTYDPSSNKMFRGLNDMMLATASGNTLHHKEYRHSLFENDRYYLIQLFPLAPATKKFIQTIEILVEKSDYTVFQIKMIEPSEDYTRIEFLNKKLNQLAGDEVFILK